MNDYGFNYYELIGPLPGIPHPVFDRDPVRPRGIPRQELDLSPEVMRSLGDALDTTPGTYGTSGALDSRGYWVPDVESDQGLPGETQA